MTTERSCLASLLLGLALSWGSAAAQAPDSEPAMAADLDRRILWSRAAGVAAVTAWGVAEWNYFQRSLHTTREGWFEASSGVGGADKAGHLFAGHLMTQAFADLYAHWGASRDLAARQGAWTALAITGFMEVGDSFSPDYGFSWEDFAMNVGGSAVGYGLHANHVWRHRLDLRLEYRPGAGDPFTDYEHSKYLVAVKLDGFAALRRTPLRWIEAYAGFYTRGYDSADPERRYLYAGVGLNLSRLAARAGFEDGARLFNYWLPPGVTAAARHRLD